MRLVGVAVVVALVSVASVSAIAVANISQQVSDNAVDISGGNAQQIPAIGAMEGGFNLLVVGTDNDASQGDAYGERDATLNDVNIMLHVAEDQKSAVVVSFPRDLIVDLPECYDAENDETYSEVYNTPLNNAYSRGGLACVVATIEHLTGLEIPFAGTISFNGVIEMTNAIGGVPVCVAGDIADSDSGLFLDEGMHTISGGMALAFLRSRHGVADGSDLGRITSQQQYMSSLMRTMKSTETLTNVVKLYGLAQAAAQNTRLSTSVANLDTMVSLALTLKDVDLDKMTFVQYPSDYSSSYPGKVVPIADLADELIEKIRNDERFLLDENSLGDYTQAAPGSEPTTPTEEPAPPADAGDGTDGTPDGTAAPTPAATPEAETLNGVLGIRADQQTCAIPN